MLKVPWVPVPWVRSKGPNGQHYAEGPIASAEPSPNAYYYKDIRVFAGGKIFSPKSYKMPAMRILQAEIGDLAV